MNASLHSGPQPALQQSARRWRSVLRAVFVCFGALMWLAFLEYGVDERQAALAAASARDRNLANAVDQYVVRVLRTAGAVHRLLGSLVAGGGSEAQLQEMLGDRLAANDVFRELALCLPDGRHLASPAAAAPASAALCRQVMAAVLPRAEVSVLAPVASAGGLQVPLVLPLEDASGRRIAVAVALAPVERLLGLLQATVLPGETVVAVAAGDGSLRAAWRSTSGPVRDAAEMAALASVLDARGAAPDLRERDYLVSSVATGTAGLRVQVASAGDDALAVFRTRLMRTALLCALITFALAAVYRLLAHMQAESLGRASDLSQARDELQALHQRLETDVRRRTSHLEQAYRDLETFSYALAHDVRAPLSRIRGFAQAMEPALAQHEDERCRHYLQRIRANATQMDDLARELLQLGRLMRAPVALAPVDLGALAEEVIAALREGEPARVVEVSVQPGLWVHGDRTLLRQVVENLVGNAWKFSARRPVAHIAVQRAGTSEDGGEVVVAVSDDGEGFDSEAATGLFQPFRRLHRAEEFPGTGLGLALVGRIVALHGGRVWCHSRPGAGACFYVALRAAAPPAIAGQDAA